MTTNYFTLRALAAEWTKELTGAVVTDVYSPRKDELAIDLSRGSESHSVRVSVRMGRHFIYRSSRSHRPRTNVTTLFGEVIGSSVASVRISPTDRILSFFVGKVRRLEVHLYGSRANVFLVGEEDEGGRIQSAFKQAGRHAGEPVPPPKKLPNLESEALMQGDGAETVEKRLSRLLPRLAKPLIRESLFRAGIDGEMTVPVSEAEATKLIHVVESLVYDLENPHAALYASIDGDILSLVPLLHLEASPVQTFTTVDEGVRTAVLLRAGRARFEELRRPLVKTLEREKLKAERKLASLEKAASTKSRADEYERWGHLLMAHPRGEIDSESLTIEDILSDGRKVEIPVRKNLTAVENAQAYYAKAKDLRTARATLDERLRDARTAFATLRDLRKEVDTASDVRELERFAKSHARLLRRIGGGHPQGSTETPSFRRFDIGGFEIWVGRNARENDRLTFDHASPHDLWFHARGVAGSHVVLRVPGRNTVVGKPVLEATASVAAWYSGSRGSGLVPVIMTERKYVSKPRGSDPGVVRVHRESVLMVEPRLP